MFDEELKEVIENILGDSRMDYYSRPPYQDCLVREEYLKDLRRLFYRILREENDKA